MTRLPKPSFANVVALIALFISLGGTVYAAAKIDGKTIRVGSIPANRLKADSLGGAQVNEAGLGQVPAAARAETATRALSAESAETARRAEEVARASEAVRADVVDSAPEAERAESADFAPAAADAESIGGLPPENLVPAAGCEEGTIKGAMVVEPSQTDLNAFRIEAGTFGCGGRPTVEAAQFGEYVVTFPGMTDGIPVAASASPEYEVSALPLGNGRFRVTTFLANESSGLVVRFFNLAIF